MGSDRRGRGEGEKEERREGVEEKEEVKGRRKHV